MRMTHLRSLRLWLLTATAGAVALLAAPRSPSHGGWASPWSELWLVSIAAAACLVLSMVLVVVGWQRRIAELALLGTALGVLSAICVVAALATPGAVDGSSNLSYTASMLELPAALVAGAPMLQPRARLSLWIALRWRGWTVAWLLGSGIALAAAWLTPDHLLAGPGSPLEGVAMAASLAGAGLLARRYLHLYRVGHDRGSLLTGAAIAYLAGIKLVSITFAASSAAWWLAHGLDAAAILVAVFGGLRLAKSHRSVAEVLAPIVTRDPLSALEIGLTPEVHAFVAALARKDQTTRDHVVRVAELTTRAAMRANFSATRLREAGLAALLHDIGKLVVPSSVLSKAGKLTDEEFAEIKTHSARGSALLRSTETLSGVADLVRWHHERYDGRGYPDGLRGGEIPFAVALISVCDAWDAMTNDRPYRSSMSAGQARAILTEGAGSQWTPQAVELVLTELAAGTATSAFASAGQGARDAEAPLVESVCADALAVPGNTSSERAGARLELERSNRRFRAVFERAPVGILLVDVHGMIREVNSALALLVGLAPSNLRETAALELVARSDVSSARRLAEGLQTHPQACQECDLSLRHATGVEVAAHVIATAVEEDDGSPCYLVQVLDRTEQRRVEQELRRLALVDELTGLCNRRGLLELGDKVLRRARLDKSPVWGIFVDLDGLKLINDECGHAAGDFALIDLGSVLADAFPEPDVVARIGGDEFFVLSSGKAEEPETISARVNEGLSARVRTYKRDYGLSVSIGIAVAPGIDESIGELVSRADLGMYGDKRRLAGSARS